MENDYKKEAKLPEIELVIEFSNLKVNELISLLNSTRNLLAFTFINFFHDYENHTKGIGGYESIRICDIDKLKNYMSEAHTVYNSLSYSYFNYYCNIRKINQIDNHGFENYRYAFDNLYDEDIFEGWLLKVLRNNDVEIIEIKSGSNIIVFSIAAFLGLTGYNYNYSILKDITLYIIEKIKALIRHQVKPDVYEHRILRQLPDIIKFLSTDKRIKKLSLRTNKNEVNLKVEWKE